MLTLYAVLRIINPSKQQTLNERKEVKNENQIRKTDQAGEQSFMIALSDLSRKTRKNMFGVYGGVNYHGEKFEAKRSIHLRPASLAAMDCGSDFKNGRQRRSHSLRV